MARRTNDFQTIRSEGGLLPSDLLRRVLNPREKLDGTLPEDYSLPQGERLIEVITQSWNRLRKHWAEFRDAAANLPEDEPGTGLTNDKWSLPLLRELSFGLLPTSAGPEVGGRTYAINRLFGPVPVHLVGCGLSLDRRTAGVRGAAAANPHGLVQEFLNRSPGHVWAIVSNGLRLRVLRDNQALSRQSFLEFDLEAMFAGEVYSDFVLLWLTAHATRFAPREGERPETCWLEHWTKLAAEQGTRALGDLRGGVEKALQILGEGFTSHPKNAALRDALRTGQVPLADFHGQLLRVVYRLIFLFVAEDRTLDGVSVLHPPAATGADNLQAGTDREQHHGLLRVAEQRTPYGLPQATSPSTTRERFAAHYSTARLRELAGKIKGSRHGDLWRQFQLLAGALSGDAPFAAVRQHLALPALGSFLWDPTSTATLNDAELTNHDFLEALRNLAFTRQGKVLRPVDYKNLGAEELGGVYESLLALTPQISADGARFNFAEFAGNERKTSGSYYTPDSLVQCLLDSALDPVVEQVIQGMTGAEAEKAILALKVCDPAVGSGHFLVGAAHRLARHLARVRALAHGESEPSPLLYQHALRDVIGRCLYGVDVNPMAAELCRVSLWLEALEPGRPLSFLDHHIRVGNSLLGATPELIAAGLPDEALTPIEGDDKKACAVLKKRNKAERKGWGPLFAQQDAETQARLQHAAAALEHLPDDRPEDIRAKELAFRRHEQTEEYRHKKHLADAWCAAFVIKKHFREPGREASASGITQGHLTGLAEGRALPTDLAAEVERLSGQYQFFHWHLAFPEVFAKDGFDCVLGNPPWEKVQPEERQFFIAIRPDISLATGADRKSLIAAIERNDERLWSEWNAYRVGFDRFSHFIRTSYRYPLSAVGNLNTSTLFLDLSAKIAGSAGRVGMIVPSGIATNEITSDFFQALVRSGRIRCLYDFENGQSMFPDVDSRFRFCLMVMGGSSRVHQGADFSFFRRSIAELADPTNHFTLDLRDFQLLSPNTGTCPTFTSMADAELTKAVYRRIPVFIREKPTETNPWRTRIYAEMYNMTRASHLFHTTEDLLERGARQERAVLCQGSDVYLPVYEARMLGHYDHRLCSVGVNPQNVFRGAVSETTTIDEHASSNHFAAPRYWLGHGDFHNEILKGYDKQWFFGFRMVTAATNERTMIATVFPRTPFVNTISGLFNDLSAEDNALLVASLCSFILDYVVRQRISGVSLNFFVAKQLPIIPPGSYPNKAFIVPRVLELTYTAWDLQPFAQDCRFTGPPFRWDDERRFLLRCELDAALFHLYLPAEKSGDWRPAEGETEENLARLKASFPTPRDAVAYIMDTFPIVRRKDEEKCNGDYRTKRVILEIYDALAESIRTGQHYQTLLNPPPADPRVAHRPRPVKQPKVPASAQTPTVGALDESRVLRRVSPHRNERYVTCVPRLDLKAAAGGFSDDHEPQFDEWVEVSPSHALQKGMFVARVVGRSMEPLIPDSAYCLFQFKAPQVRNDLIGLFQLYSAEDPELGGRFTVKKLKVSTQSDPEEGLRRVATLVPENPMFQPIAVAADDIRLVAEFLEVLRPFADRTGDDQIRVNP